MKNSKFIQVLSAVIFSAILMSCGNSVHNIPAGYVGKVLTPTGWAQDIKEAGQVDLGVENNNGTSNSLTILEVTTTTVKEQFMGAEESTDKQDHRIRTKNGTPLIVDIYVQIATPTDDKTRNNIFQLVTPLSTANPRVSIINLTDIYTRFATQTIRSKTRAIFAHYENADSIMNNYDKVNAEIALMVIEVVKQSKAPFTIISAQLSNVKEDDVILASKNKIAESENQIQTIEKIGKALKENPQYLEVRRLEVLEKIGANSKSNLIVMDTKSQGVISIPTK